MDGNLAMANYIVYETEEQSKIGIDMAIANPRIHMICGVCGSNKMMKYRIGTYLDDDSGEEYYTVNIVCENCSSLTGLYEVIEEEKRRKKGE